VDIVDAKNEYHYYMAVTAEKSCMRCHGQPHLDPQVKEGEMMGVIKIVLPLQVTKSALARNYAILLATAIVTAFLAMLALYAMVRYIIVKPVLHLKEISDEIARGTLDLRADIRTGDEFEELGHAFNRMLRHQATVQDELREVNVDLDAKVDQLAQKNLRLYEMTKLKDDFLATMSHELRTPLNSILGFSEVLAGSANLTDKQKRFLQNIQISGNNLMVIINDLLDLAKIESGKMEIQAVEFSLADLIERQIASLVLLAEKKNIELSSEIDASIPTLLQDPLKLQQILNNLLSNAIKFTPEGGRVRVRANVVDERFFELIVEDTGVGIPLEEQELVFEKFRQGQTLPGQRDTMTREYGGTGLGLSIVKEMSKLLGGEVLLVSEFGKGSTFTVKLPLRLDDGSPRRNVPLVEQVVGLNRISTKLLDANQKEAVKSLERASGQAGEPAA
ncbi:MAG: ATP-binding protein, partial [Planctomycetaceae bacterium]